LDVEVLAPGFIVPPWAGPAATFQRATFKDGVGREVEGFRAELTASFRGRSKDLAVDRAAVVAQALLDLLLRWPLAEPQIRVTVNGVLLGRPRDISLLQPYEVGAILGGGPELPRALLTVDAEVPARIELVWSLVLKKPVAVLDQLLGPLSQASTAAAASHPFDRVTPLWSAVELLYPRLHNDLSRIDAITFLDPKTAADEVARGDPVLRRLLSFRSRLARDTWFYPPVRQRLAQSTRSNLGRVRVATTIAYAVRCKIVHGQWARFRDDHRLEAGAAERWLWQLLEREVELRVTGGRLEPLRAAGAAKFGV
jgi:hypothetical protein